MRSTAAWRVVIWAAAVTGAFPRLVLAQGGLPSAPPLSARALSASLAPVEPRRVEGQGGGSGGTRHRGAQRAEALRKDWLLGVSAGWERTSNSTAGTGMLPAAGTPFSVFGRTTPTRPVPTWFAGDGAALFNSVQTSFNQTALIQPIDAVLTTQSVRQNSGINLDLHVEHRLTDNWSVRFNTAFYHAPIVLTDSARTTLSNGVSSFKTGWTNLLGPAPGFAVSSNSQMTDGAGCWMMFGAGAKYRFPTREHITPYAFTDVGVLRYDSTDTPVVMLMGDYRAGITGSTGPTSFPPFHETDNLTIRFPFKNTKYMDFGGGIERPLGASGFSVYTEVGETIFGNSSQTSFDTAPTRDTTSSQNVLFFTTSPTIQISSVPQVMSSLSTSLQNVQSFSGRGHRFNTRLSFGVELGF